MARHLVAGEPRLHEVVQLGAGQARVLLHREQLRRLARMLVRHADHSAFQEAALAHGDVLDFVREHLEAGDGDHVLLAVDDAHAALHVHDADVAGAEEAIRRHRLSGLIRPLPVAGHHLRAARADLAFLAGRQFVAGLVADRDFGRRQRQADGAGPCADVAAIAGQYRRGLRQAVAFDDRLAGRLHPRLGDGFLHGHAAGDRAFQSAPVERLEIGMMQQRIVQRVHRRERVHLVFGDLLDQPGNVARIGNENTHSAAADGGQQTRCQCEDVIERQCGDDHHALHVRRRGDHGRLPGIDLQHVGDQIAMQKHRTLCHAGRAAGVLQEGDVVGADVDPREPRAAAGDERIVELHRARNVVARHHFLHVAHEAVDDCALGAAEHVAKAGDDDKLRWCLRQRLLQHGGEVLQHDDRLGAGVRELEFELARLVQRIGVHHRAAGAQRPRDRDRVLQHVRHHQGDTRAAPEPA